MTAQPRKLEVFANPFFVVLIATSVLFVLTVLGYLVSLYVLEPDANRGPMAARSVALASWLDRNGPLALGVEFIVMLISGIIAMATDHWFSPRPKQNRR